MKPKIGLVIGTHGTPAYVAMQIKSRLLFEPDMPMLVHDDCSQRIEEIAAMTKSSGVDFDCTLLHCGHIKGDLACFKNGLLWAKNIDVEFLVKMSRRYIPIVSWTDDLCRMMDDKSQTFSSVNRVFNMDFSTHLMAMRVSEWLKMVPDIEKAIANDKILSVEWLMYRLAVKIDPFRDMACQQWSLTEGLERHKRRALWRDKNSAFDYVNTAAGWGLNYPTYELVI